MPLARFAAFSLLASAPIFAQTPQPGPLIPPPSINITTTSNMKVTPDRATIRISVQTRATTAAAAASANATKQNAVLNSLRKLGLSNDQLSTADYNVTPEYKYQQNQEPVLTGYTVTNTVLADIHDVNQVGKILDAALGSGANLVSSLEFYASNTEAARQQATTEAIAKARKEADAAARAAGGSIGGLLELNIGANESFPPPRPMYRMAADAAAGTPINPGQQLLTVTVNTRWLFTPNR
jgi:uncharacterized protein YggE